MARIRAVLVNIGIDKIGIPGAIISRKLELGKSAISKLNQQRENIFRGELDILENILGESCAK